MSFSEAGCRFQPPWGMYQTLRSKAKGNPQVMIAELEGRKEGKQPAEHLTHVRNEVLSVPLLRQI